MGDEGSTKLNNKYPIIIGILFVLAGIAFFFSGEYQDAYSEIVLGLIFIFFGIFFKDKIKWNEMPTGIKFLICFLWFRFFVISWGIYKEFNPFEFFFGFMLQFPISIIVKPIMLFIVAITLIAIYNRVWWKLILWLQGFAIVNSITFGFWMMTATLEELLTIAGKDTSTVMIPQAEIIMKSIVMIPVLIALIVGIVIWVYIYKKKDYFQNQQTPIQNQPTLIQNQPTLIQNQPTLIQNQQDTNKNSK